MRDLYKDLGLGEDATEAQIKSAFRKLAKEHHPDRKSGDDTRFKEINEAYEVLSDPAKKQKYDQMRRYGGDPSAMGGFADGIDLSDLFGSFFGGGGGFDFGEGFSGRPRRPARGRDSQVEVQVPFTTAAMGGQVAISTTGGRQLEIRIPASTQSGRKLRLKGQGSPAQGGGTAGDLYVHVKVAPDPRFRMEGTNIISDLHVDHLDCILGTTVEVETLHGKVDLTIPAGLKPGSRLRVTGFGIRTEKAKGDHFVVIYADLPRQLNQEQTKLYEKLREIRDNS